QVHRYCTLPDRPLTAQPFHLRFLELLSARVGEQPVGGACDVLQMEAERGRAARRDPQLLRLDQWNDLLEIPLYLHERVRYGLHGRADPLDWPSEPRFRM